MYRASLLLFFLISSCCGAAVNVILKDENTVVLTVDNLSNDAFYSGLKAEITTNNKQEVIKGETKHKELILKSQENLENGFKVTYSILTFDRLKETSEKGSFSFKYNPETLTRKKRDFEDVESRFGYHGHQFKPRKHGIGHFPKHQNFPPHGPPPFWPVNDFGHHHHHHGWDSGFHQKDFDPCSSSERGSSSGSFEGFDKNNFNFNDKRRTSTSTTSTSTTLAPTSSTWPQIDIRSNINE